MNKFFLMTRGRTGSTAIMEELDMRYSFRAMPELFMIYHYGDVSEIYSISTPFVLWKQQLRLRKRIPLFFYSDAQWANLYLAELEIFVKQHGITSFGFKVLSPNFSEWKFLGKLLRRRGYQAIYLTRNVARRVLSGMVASQSGVWNIKGEVEVPSCTINLDEFQRLIRLEKWEEARDIARLTAMGFNFIVVSYEEFYNNREAFHDKISLFLDIPKELPPRSEYSIVIKDLKETIVNYEAVVERAAKLGFSLDTYIHEKAEVKTSSIGSKTKIWQYSIVLKEAKIGSNCNINAQCFIENDVVIGNNVTVKCGVQLWDGIRVEDNVFIGPNVTFTNDKYPRSKKYPEEFEKTIIKRNASIGANATILAGITIGENAMIGAGSVVTKDVPDGEIWYGNPAKSHGKVKATSAQ